MDTPILSKESVRRRLYAKSPEDLGTIQDDIFRNKVDELLDNPIFEIVLDSIYEIMMKQLKG